MPPVAIAVAAAAAGSIAGGIIGSIISLVVSVALNAAFAKKPSSPASSDGGSLAARSQTLTSLDPAASWQAVYGEVVKGGTVVFRHATDALGEDLASESHVVPATAPYIITLAAAADYVSTSAVRTEEWVAAPGENEYLITDLAVSGGAPADGEYAVSAGTYTFNEAQAGKSVTVQFNRRIVSVAHGLLHLVIVLAAHESEEISAIYFNDELVPLDGNGDALGRYLGHARIKKHLGADDQAADATLMSEAPDKWTSTDRLQGHTYIYVRLRKNFDIFPTGLPNITVKMKGRKVYDSRSGLTVWSHNWALCLADYLHDPVIGLNAAYGTEIDSTLLSAAANVCDEAVSLAAGGTEDRYACDGIVDTSQTPQDIIEKMLTAGAGRLVYVGGTWRIRAGAYITPSVTLDEGDARGPIKVQTRLSRRESFSAVKGVYVSPENNWQPADFPPVTNATYYAEDGNERVWFDMELPFTTSAATAQRIAKIELERARQQITVTYPAKLNAYMVEPPETMRLNNTKFGYSSKVFEALESRLVVDRDPKGNPVLGVNLTLRETAAAVYSWNSGEETTIDPAPDTSLPDPGAVAPPGIPAVTESIYSTSDSAGAKTKAIVSWAAAPAGQAWRYEHEYKLRSAVTWIPHGGLINGTNDEIEDLAAGNYQSRVRTVTVLGARSTWAQREYELTGLSARPSDVVGFAVQSYAGRARFVWERSPDIDVRLGGRVIVRWSPQTSGVDWNNSGPVNAEGFPGDVTLGEGPLQTGTYLAKFRDSTGNYSVNATSFVITAALLRAMTSLGFVDFHPTFAGGLVNTVVTGGKVQLTAVTLWDDMPGDMDDWGVIDYVGGISSAGSVSLADKLDLGSVQTARIFATIESEGFEIGDTWDARTTPMDDWGTVDGDVIEDADVTIMVRTTNDDPIGSPSASWGPWHPLNLVADYTARGFEFRLDFMTADPTHNRRVSVLTITAKQEV